MIVGAGGGAGGSCRVTRLNDDVGRYDGEIREMRCVGGLGQQAPSITISMKIIDQWSERDQRWHEVERIVTKRVIHHHAGAAIGKAAGK